MIYGYKFQRGVHQALIDLSQDNQERFFSTAEVREAFLLSFGYNRDDNYDLYTDHCFYVRIRNFLNNLVKDEMADRIYQADDKSKIQVTKFRIKQIEWILK